MKNIKTYEYFSNQVSAAGVSVDGGHSTDSSANDTRKDKNNSDITPSNDKITSKKRSNRVKLFNDFKKPIEYSTPTFKTGDFYLGI